MEEKLQQLKTRLMEISDLNSATSLLEWDQMTYMPPGGAPARARQAALLQRLAHEKRVDPALGKLLDDLQPYAESHPYDSDEASLIRVARRDYEKAIKVPPEFVAEVNAHAAESFQVWHKARPEDDFGATLPYLQKTLDLSRQFADFFPGYDHIADPLIDQFDYGLKASTVSALFAELCQQLTPIVRAIAAQPAADDDACLRQHFPERGQWDFGLDVVQRFGYDLARGRQDKAPHPFTIEFSIGDVRITTRVDEEYLGDCLFSTVHEAGHALYEQGSRRELEGSPLAGGTSAGVHESQSRLWENVVGRSRGFWQFFYPKLHQVFPEQLGSTPLDTFYQAVNKVEPSLIRVEADEVTYNLHVMLRFDLELAMLEGNLAVKDLPQVWRERYESDLGVVPPDDRDGVLQDIHWYMGLIGGNFQGYTLGNVLSAQFYDAALQARPDIPDGIARGEFGALHGWLVENIYQHGRKFTANELVERVTGGPLRIEPYIRYLRTKYGELYEL